MERDRFLGEKPKNLAVSRFGLFIVATFRRMVEAMTVVALCVGCGCESRNLEPTLRHDCAEATSANRVAPPAQLPSPSESLRTEPIDWEHSSVMRGLQRLTSKMQSSACVHGIDVDVRRGRYGFDCSGMVEWVLRDFARQAYRKLRRPVDYRPLARDFVFHIAQLAAEAERGGGKRVVRVTDAQPGDVLA